MTTYIKYYKTAGITFSVKSDIPITEDTFHPKFKLFEVDAPGDDNVTINHHFYVPKKLLNCLNPNKSKKVFTNEFLSVHKTNNMWIYNQKASTRFNIKYNAIVIFNDEHTKGDVYTNDLNETSYSEEHIGSLVLFGGDHYLLANILSYRQGFLLHANGLAFNDRGILLIGKSGAGKTTLSNMLRQSGFSLVADDRVVLQKIESKYYLIGSWCHGSNVAVTNKKVLLEKIFFLKKSQKNKIITETSTHERLKQFSSSIVRPFGDQEKWKNILNNMEKIVKHHFFYSIYFNLSKNICTVLKENL
ncbi:MAG: hypothetical protein U9P10_05690 [Thermodesulfobacteriota bacterium]|nr:hypothetical protein [Thermodesulfobacteriota bacterium]